MVSAWATFGGTVSVLGREEPSTQNKMGGLKKVAGGRRE